MVVNLGIKFQSPLPPPYPGNEKNKSKGPLKRILDGLKALFHGNGKRRSPVPDLRYKRFLAASLNYLDAALKSTETELVWYAALLESHFAAVESLHAEKRLVEANLQCREDQKDIDELGKKVFARAIESLEAKLKHEAARKVSIEARLESLKTDKDTTQAAICFVETDLRDRYPEGQCSKA